MWKTLLLFLCWYNLPEAKKKIFFSDEQKTSAKTSMQERADGREGVEKLILQSENFYKKLYNHQIAVWLPAYLFTVKR